MSDPTCQFSVTHQTRYRYSEPVAICQNQVMMVPRRLPRVRCQETEIVVKPTPTLFFSHVDHFGNHVHTFSIESAHRELSVHVHSIVEVTEPTLPATADGFTWEAVREAILSTQDANWFNVCDFRFASPLISLGKPFADYALRSFQPGRSIVDAGLDLTRRIQRDFKYQSGTTAVDTTAEKAFSMRTGVCQDFAQIQIACLRSIGLAARYVSGYLRTLPPPGKPRLIGSDQSHAWLSLYGGETLGWIDFDPTNGCLVKADHIPICVGRDYRDVAPMRGVVLGGGRTSLSVSVDVEPIRVASPKPNSLSR